MKTQSANWKQSKRLLIFLPILLLASACESVTLGPDRFCKKFKDAPPVHYYGTDSETEKREKDILVAFWITRCGEPEAILAPEV